MNVALEPRFDRLTKEPCCSKQMVYKQKCVNLGKKLGCSKHVVSKWIFSLKGSYQYCVLFAVGVFMRVGTCGMGTMDTFLLLVSTFLIMEGFYLGTTCFFSAESSTKP